MELRPKAQHDLRQKGMMEDDDVRQEREYLGDGLYAEYDGYQLILAAGNGVFDHDTVYLEPSVLLALIDYTKRIGMLK